VRRIRLVVLSLLLGSFTLVRASTAEVTFYASWHAAWGEPGASDTLMGACDNTGADTLFLSFDPGDTIPAFIALKATVGFHCALQDSFGDRWMFGGGVGNAYNVKVEAGPNETFHTLQPWTSNAIGGVNFDRGRQHGYLRILYAQDSATPTRLLPGKRYCWARLIFPHPPEVPLCHQPVCIEIQSTDLYQEHKEWLGRVGGPRRFASMNSPDGSVCNEQKKARPKAWSPIKR
jgi:hypothetical protein